MPKILPIIQHQALMKNTSILFTAVLIATLVSTMAHAKGSPVDKTKSSRQGYHHRFKDAHKWSQVFDDPSRDEWQQPEKVLASLKLQSTDKVADIGAGTGYFAVRIAMVLPAGKVFAIDTEPDMTKYLAQVAKEKSLANLFPIKTEPDDLKLPEKVNLVIIVDTLHHIDDRIRYLAKLKQQLLPEARLAVIDFNQSSKEGPPVAHRLAKERVVDEVKSAGYVLKEDLEYLPNQYFLVFQVTK